MTVQDDPPPRVEHPVTAAQVEAAANGTLGEWLDGYLELDASGETTTGRRQVRIRPHTDGLWHVADPQGYFEYGRFRITVHVEQVDV